MRSKFADYLDQMQRIADIDNITIAASHYDVLDYYFNAKQSVEEAVLNYKKFLIRWNALTGNYKTYTSYTTNLDMILSDLFKEIKHGDQEHQDWLESKIKDFSFRYSANTQDNLKEGE